MDPESLHSGPATLPEARVERGELEGKRRLLAGRVRLLRERPEQAHPARPAPRRSWRRSDGPRGARCSGERIEQSARSHGDRGNRRSGAGLEHRSRRRPCAREGQREGPVPSKALGHGTGGAEGGHVRAVHESPRGPGRRVPRLRSPSSRDRSRERTYGARPWERGGARLGRTPRGGPAREGGRPATGRVELGGSTVRSGGGALHPGIGSVGSFGGEQVSGERVPSAYAQRPRFHKSSLPPVGRQEEGSSRNPRDRRSRHRFPRAHLRGRTATEHRKAEVRRNAGKTAVGTDPFRAGGATGRSDRAFARGTASRSPDSLEATCPIRRYGRAWRPRTPVRDELGRACRRPVPGVRSRARRKRSRLAVESGDSRGVWTQGTTRDSWGGSSPGRVRP